MNDKKFCTEGWAAALRRGTLALIAGATLGAGVLGAHAIPASAHSPSHDPHPTTQNTSVVVPSNGTQQLNGGSGTAHCDAIGPNGPACPQPGSQQPSGTSSGCGPFCPPPSDGLYCPSRYSTGNAPDYCVAGPTTPSTGTQQPGSGTAHCDAIGPDGPVCPQPGTQQLGCCSIGGGTGISISCGLFCGDPEQPGGGTGTGVNCPQAEASGQSSDPCAGKETGWAPAAPPTPGSQQPSGVVVGS